MGMGRREGNIRLGGLRLPLEGWRRGLCIVAGAKLDIGVLSVLIDME